LYIFEICNIHLAKLAADDQGKVRSAVQEDKTFENDSLYKNICRRIIGKCSFLLLAVQPAILGEFVLQVYNIQICC